MNAPSMRLIVPHFGERPSYFPLVVKSMARNPDVSWLLFTDRPVADAPPNVVVRRCDFADLAARFRRHFDFAISLDRPYKFCDFRPAFGEIFEAELAGYDVWGHCDLDVIFGRIQYRSARTTSRPGGRIVRFCRWTRSAVRLTISPRSSRYSHTSPSSQA